MTDAPEARSLVEARRNRLQATVGRPLRIPPGSDGDPLEPANRRYLLEEVQELYFNDMEWENLTEEERMEGGPLTELTFPGVLAFVRGLLLTEVRPDALAKAEPRPEVVEDFLDFLASRVVALNAEARAGDGDGPDRAALEHRMTNGLLDQVLMVYHGISPEDVGSMGDA
jgi:hypothetical protein